ncbi:hypothetical protein HYFRA_00009090 [Hymenoscyphus fraxineus]|uniref:1-alkyl-2-acetylglycerophosphocholine esterase n=1 Tax=Hymenoscyphus fraxineus TaxID=746836 RepID=A0A9N9PNW2_9HELO|nr:hypothetical protein HYFRA_00009090 [Hymenoscyphus fraxineus]
MKNLAKIISASNLFFVVANALLLSPPGPDIQLGTATAELIDYSRTNVWGNNSDPRAFLISVFYPLGVKPCSGGYRTEYVSKTVSDFEDGYFFQRGILGKLDYNSFESQFYQECSENNDGDYPVLIFSPGYFRTRLLYGVLAQTVAKFGYIVITVDHPYDADIVVMPSGQVIAGVDETNLSTIEDYQGAVDTRVADFRFLLDQLEDPKLANALLPTVPYRLNVTKVGMFGHSLGGASSANLMITDDRVAGGINLDGSLWPPVSEVGLDQPFMFMGSVIDGTTAHSHFTDESWYDTWALLRGFKYDITLNNSRHSTYGDLTYLLESLDHVPMDNETLTVGTVDGGVAMVDISTVVVDLFDWVLKGKERRKGGGERGDSTTFDVSIHEWFTMRLSVWHEDKIVGHTKVCELSTLL